MSRTGPPPGIDEDVWRLVRAQGVECLYEVQSRALAPALRGRNVVLAIPTASGKSLVGYLTLVQAAIHGRKGIYIVPLRALASEKYRDLRAFEALGIRVGISTGDYDASDPWLTKYDIVIATSEKADALIRQRSRFIDEMSVVVGDEVHMINDPGRGPTMEVLLSRFAEMGVQIVALSATISNAEVLSSWLDAVCISDDWRPVPLREGVYCQGRIWFDDGSVQDAIQPMKDPVSALVSDTLADDGQCLVFVSTRRSCVSQAVSLAPLVRAMLDEPSISRLREVSGRLRASGEETTTLVARLAGCVESGVAFHHAGLADTHRNEVEAAFRSRDLRVLVATTTLAAGVNLPARRVIVRDVHRYSSDVGMSVPLPVFEVKQMCGRAGRPGYDACGEAIILARSERAIDDLMERYVLGRSENIVSRLAAEPALRSHILARITTARSSTTTVEDIQRFIASTFYAHTGSPDVIQRNIARVLTYLESAGFILSSEEGFQATRLGTLCSDLYLDPLSVERFVQGLKAAEERHPPTAYLHLVSCAVEMPLIFPRRMRLQDAYDDVLSGDWLVPPPENESEMEYFLAQVWTANMLTSWIMESPEETITQMFSIGPGDIRSRAEIAEWLLYGCSRLALHIDTPHPRLQGTLKDLTLRVRYGVGEDLLPLVRLPGVGRVRSRQMYEAGVRTLEDVIGMPEERLAAIRSIGPALARRIREAAVDAYR